MSRGDEEHPLNTVASELPEETREPDVEETGGVPARWRAMRRRGLLVLVIVAIIAGVLVWKTTRPDEGVVNGRASYDLEGWNGRSDAGRVILRRSHVFAPQGITTAVDVRMNVPRPAKWARVMVHLRDPQHFLELGHAYRLQMYVRSLVPGHLTVGMLLANENYAGRPAEVSKYIALDDTAWHRMSLTMTVTSRASKDTGVYIALPADAVQHWQIAGVSLRSTTIPRPPHAATPPDQVISFTGEAGTAPDSSLWTHDVGAGGWGNHELQTYTNSKHNAALDGQGHLNITALQRQASVPGPEYTSARLNTKGKLEVAPGSYVEASIKAPVGKGVWPAFWLLGSSMSQVGWPAAGELDIMEILGSDPDTVHNALHMPSLTNSTVDRPYGGNGNEEGVTRLPGGTHTQSHRYGVFFDGRMVVFYIDRHPALTYTAKAARASGRAWPFGQPMYLVLDVAVGGREDPTGTTFPRSMEVGDISIWKGGVPF